MRFEPAKSILQAISHGSDGSEFFPRDYNMNLYRGCSHGCVYCDARSACYHLDAPGEVRAKENALGILDDELRRRRTPGIVGLGGMSDGYNPEEGTSCITRGALILLARYGFGIGVTTKSPLVARDIDLLLSIQKNAPAHVTFSITTASDSMSLFIEPGVAPSSARFAALKSLTAAGIPAGVWINPVLPFLTDTDENIISLLEMARASGAAYVHTYMGMTLREGNREYYYAALDRHFPGVKALYTKTYGNSYILPSLKSKALFQRYEETCERLALPFTFRETNAIIRQSGGFKQERLFE